MIHRPEVAEQVRKLAVSFGDFELSGGGRSHYFIDAGKLLYGPLFWQLTHILWEQVRDVQGVSHVGGPCVGADPWIGSLLAHSAIFRTDSWSGFLIRKEPKKNGEMIEGVVPPAGANVLIVDDVITTGGQTHRAILEVEKLGAKVVAVACLVDRQAGARERFEGSGYAYRPIFTAADLVPIDSGSGSAGP